MAWVVDSRRIYSVTRQKLEKLDAATASDNKFSKVQRGVQRLRQVTGLVAEACKETKVVKAVLQAIGITLADRVITDKEAINALKMRNTLAQIGKLHARIKKISKEEMTEGLREVAATIGKLKSALRGSAEEVQRTLERLSELLSGFAGEDDEVGKLLSLITDIKADMSVSRVYLEGLASKYDAIAGVQASLESRRPSLGSFQDVPSKHPSTYDDVESEQTMDQANDFIPAATPESDLGKHATHGERISEKLPPVSTDVHRKVEKPSADLRFRVPGMRTEARERHREQVQALKQSTQSAKEGVELHIIQNDGLAIGSSRGTFKRRVSMLALNRLRTANNLQASRSSLAELASLASDEEWNQEGAVLGQRYEGTSSHGRSMPSHASSQGFQTTFQPRRQSREPGHLDTLTVGVHPSEFAEIPRAARPGRRHRGSTLNMQTLAKVRASLARGATSSMEHDLQVASTSYTKSQATSRSETKEATKTEPKRHSGSEGRRSTPEIDPESGDSDSGSDSESDSSEDQNATSDQDEWRMQEDAIRSLFMSSPEGSEDEDDLNQYQHHNGLLQRKDSCIVDLPKLVQLEDPLKGAKIVRVLDGQVVKGTVSSVLYDSNQHRRLYGAEYENGTTELLTYELVLRFQDRQDLGDVSEKDAASDPMLHVKTRQILKDKIITGYVDAVLFDKIMKQRVYRMVCSDGHGEPHIEYHTAEEVKALEDTLVLHWRGRSYTGADGDFDEIAAHCRQQLGGDAGVTVAFVARFDTLTRGATVLEIVGEEPMCSVLRILADEESGGLHMEQTSSEVESKVTRFNDSATCGQDEEYLISVNSDGFAMLMRNCLRQSSGSGLAVQQSRCKKVTIGASTGSDACPLRGEVRDLMIWNKVMSWEEVQQIKAQACSDELQELPDHDKAMDALWNVTVVKRIGWRTYVGKVKDIKVHNNSKVRKYIAVYKDGSEDELTAKQVRDLQDTALVDVPDVLKWKDISFRTRIVRLLNGKVCVGYVEDSYFQPTTGDRLYEVHYGDGSMETLTSAQVLKFQDKGGLLKLPEEEKLKEPLMKSKIRQNLKGEELSGYVEDVYWDVDMQERVYRVRYEDGTTADVFADKLRSLQELITRPTSQESGRWSDFSYTSSEEEVKDMRTSMPLLRVSSSKGILPQMQLEGFVLPRIGDHSPRVGSASARDTLRHRVKAAPLALRASVPGNTYTLEAVLTSRHRRGLRERLCPEALEDKVKSKLCIDPRVPCFCKRCMPSSLGGISLK